LDVSAAPQAGAVAVLIGARGVTRAAVLIRRLLLLRSRAMHRRLRLTHSMA
jgi:hypothetical protein